MVNGSISAHVKAMGYKSLDEATLKSGVSRQTLSNWHKRQVPWLDCTLKGALYMDKIAVLEGLINGR